MKKKKEEIKKKKFFNLTTGKPISYLTLSPNCPDELVRCYKNPPRKKQPSEKPLKDCPEDVAGRCPYASALESQVKQLSSDKQTAQPILKAFDLREDLMYLLLFGNDSEVPDELFFEVLRNHGHEILCKLPFAQQKVSRWEKEKGSADDKIRNDAKDNLRKIGATLAETGHERGNLSPGIIGILWHSWHEEIRRQRLHELRGKGILALRIRELLSGRVTVEQEAAIIKAIKNHTGRKTSQSLANIVVASLYNLSVLSVKQYRKEAQVVPGAYSLE